MSQASLDRKLKRVAMWNRKYEVGQRVIYTPPLGSEPIHTVTRSAAFLTEADIPAVRIAGQEGSIGLGGLKALNSSSKETHSENG